MFNCYGKVIQLKSDDEKSWGQFVFNDSRVIVLIDKDKQTKSQTNSTENNTTVATLHRVSGRKPLSDCLNCLKKKTKD